MLKRELSAYINEYLAQSIRVENLRDTNADLDLVYKATASSYAARQDLAEALVDSPEESFRLEAFNKAGLPVTLTRDPEDENGFVVTVEGADDQFLKGSQTKYKDLKSASEDFVRCADARTIKHVEEAAPEVAQTSDNDESMFDQHSFNPIQFAG